MGEFMWNYLQSMLVGSSEVSEGATSPEPRRGPPSVCLGVGLSERRLFLANSRVSIQAAVRARLGLVSPAVGAAAVQRGALQDQQPSGEIHQSRIPGDGGRHKSSLPAKFTKAGFRWTVVSPWRHLLWSCCYLRPVSGQHRHTKS